MNTFLLTIDPQSSPYQIGYMMGTVIGFIMLISIPILMVFSIVKFVKTRHKGWLVSAIISGIPIALFFLAFVFGMILGLYRQAKSSASDSKKEISANRIVPIDENSIFVRLPNHWKIMENLNENAIFQAGNAIKEEYMIAIDYAKSDIEGGLGGLSEMLLQEILANIEDPVIVSSEMIEINGMNAYQYEISAAVNHLKVVYLNTVIETSEYYYQILGWTLKSRKETALPVIKEVLNSITEQSV